MERCQRCVPKPNVLSQRDVAKVEGPRSIWLRRRAMWLTQRIAIATLRDGARICES
jgi:hypothetical protein